MVRGAEEWLELVGPFAPSAAEVPVPFESQKAFCPPTQTHARKPISSNHRTHTVSNISKRWGVVVCVRVRVLQSLRQAIAGFVQICADADGADRVVNVEIAEKWTRQHWSAALQPCLDPRPLCNAAGLVKPKSDDSCVYVPHRVCATSRMTLCYIVYVLHCSVPELEPAEHARFFEPAAAWVRESWSWAMGGGAPAVAAHGRPCIALPCQPTTNTPWGCVRQPSQRSGANYAPAGFTAVGRHVRALACREHPRCKPDCCKGTTAWTTRGRGGAVDAGERRHRGAEC